MICFRSVRTPPQALTRAISVFLLCAGIASLGAAQSSEVLSKASEEYEAGRFREAIERYESVARGGDTSAALHYNLGNAWFHAGEPGRAILNYRRALALEPQHPEAQANLQFARDKARALELRKNWWDKWLAHATPAAYSVAAAVAFWGAAFCLAAIVFSRRRSRLPVVALVFALLALTTFAVAIYAVETGPVGRALAVVTAGNIHARLATADSAGAVLALPAGSEVRILSERGDWIYAALPNNLRGWIPAKSAERVRL